MNTDDIKEYWPKASIAQVRAIQVYHDSGWQINPQEEDGMIPCHRSDTMETVGHSLITSDGRMIPWSNARAENALDELAERLDFQEKLNRECIDQIATMTDQRDAAMQCHECREDRKRIIEELIKVTEQRDRLAALLQRNRDGYGGQMVDPECGCCDCKWLQPIDEALAAWKEARSESALP